MNILRPKISEAFHIATIQLIDHPSSSLQYCISKLIQTQYCRVCFQERVSGAICDMSRRGRPGRRIPTDAGCQPNPTIWMVGPYKLDYSLVAREVRRLAAAFGPSDKRSSAKSCMNARNSSRSTSQYLIVDVAVIDSLVLTRDNMRLSSCK